MTRILDPHESAAGSNASTAAPVRKLRMLGDGVHGEPTITTRNASHPVHTHLTGQIYPGSDSYRQTYIVGVYDYDQPEIAAAVDSGDMLIGDDQVNIVGEVMAGCPCATKI